METEVVLVLGIVGIIALLILGLAVVLIGGKLRATRNHLEVTSHPESPRSDHP